MTNHKVHGIVHEERTLLDTLQQKQKKLLRHVFEHECRTRCWKYSL